MRFVTATESMNCTLMFSSFECAESEKVMWCVISVEYDEHASAKALKKVHLNKLISNFIESPISFDESLK